MSSVTSLVSIYINDYAVSGPSSVLPVRSLRASNFKFLATALFENIYPFRRNCSKLIKTGKWDPLLVILTAVRDDLAQGPCPTIAWRAFIDEPALHPTLLSLYHVA